MPDGVHGVIPVLKIRPSIRPVREYGTRYSKPTYGLRESKFITRWLGLATVKQEMKTGVNEACINHYARRFDRRTVTRKTATQRRRTIIRRQTHINLAVSSVKPLDQFTPQANVRIWLLCNNPKARYNVSTPNSTSDAHTRLY